MFNIKEIINNQNNYFEKGQTKDLAFRLNKLTVLKKMITENDEAIMAALKKDLNKAPFESYETEIGILLEEINYVIKNLPRWDKRKKVCTPLINFLSSSYVYSEPYGVALVISPWNYPFQLTISPLIGSIAAGNCTLIKPSEYSVYTSELLEDLMARYFEPGFISVVKGDKDVSQQLLEEKFDYIFFTGSVEVGKIIMKAASKHLTPVTLELGGKSPCIIDETADLDLAAKRIVWGKFLNAGQTCIAPDYLLVQSTIEKALVSKIETYIEQFYGKEPHRNDDYPKIISMNHFQRLLNLLKDQKIIAGGNYDLNSQQIEPTLLGAVSWDSPVMQEEIFGPILPIITFDTIGEVIKSVNNRPKPLALYYFSTNKKRQNKIIEEISFGGGCVNDTIMQVGSSYMPFGGVGESGMGSYHGKASFDTFSHKKSVVHKSNLVDINLRYPPFKNKLKWIKKVMR